MFTSWKQDHLFLELVLCKADNALVLGRLSKIASLAISLQDAQFILYDVSMINISVLEKISIQVKAMVIFYLKIQFLKLVPLTFVFKMLAVLSLKI